MPSGRGERVLVVEDDEKQRWLATTILTKLGYHAIAVATGEEAIALVRSETFDILILDMILNGGFGGLQTYRELMVSTPKCAPS